MDVSPDSLPNDVEALRAFALQAMAEKIAARAERDVAVCERDALAAERDNLMSLCDRLRHLLRQHQRMRFGRKSEQLDEGQLALALEEIEQAIAKAEAASEPKQRHEREGGGARRGSLPAHLPREHVRIAPDDTNCPCCRAPMHEIGEDTSERLDVIPAQFRVIVTHRPKFACRNCDGKVVQEAAPARLIASGIPTEAMVAHVLVSKYAWHLPLYRQAQMLETQGIDISRSVLAFWVGYAAVELMPVYDRLKLLLLTSAKLVVDETTVPVLDPGRGVTKKGYFWTIARDDRSWAGPDPPAVAFTYAPGRGAKHGHALLADYTGIVQCDGYSAYKSLDERRITLAFCWTHLRRQFYDIAKEGDAPIASEALARIAALYAIESEIRGMSPERRCAVRQQKSKPLVLAFREWVETQLVRVSGKSPIAKALRYALRHWDGLVRFLDDGRIELDTNIVERAIRPVAATCSLYPSSSSAWKHWKLIPGILVTRTMCSRDRSNDGVRLEVGRSNLVRRARHHLLGRQNAIFDQAANAMMRDAKLRRGFRHRQPFTVLLGRTISMNAVHSSH
jgi:transposase